MGGTQAWRTLSHVADSSPHPTSAGLAKIIDGPLAVLPPGGTHTGEVGTATYSAPEVVARQPYGTKSDAWSAGVVILEMLRGGIPVRRQQLLRSDRSKSQISSIKPQNLNM